MSEVNLCHVMCVVCRMHVLQTKAEAGHRVQKDGSSQTTGQVQHTKGTKQTTLQANADKNADGSHSIGGSATYSNAKPGAEFAAQAQGAVGRDANGKLNGKASLEVRKGDTVTKGSVEHSAEGGSKVGVGYENKATVCVCLCVCDG